MRRSSAILLVVLGLAMLTLPLAAETIIGGIDMGIEKSVDNAVAARGDTLTYTLVATNYGEFGEREGYVVDTLPDGVTFVSVDAPTANSCTVNGQVIECYFPLWNPITFDPVTAVHTITIVVTVDADATGTLLNHALVESRDPSPTAPVDGDPTNDEDTATTDVILASIGDEVWLDANGDGVFDADESGLPDVVVNLDGPDGPMSTTTDANGLYLFDDLSGGDYTVTVDTSTAPADTILTTPGEFAVSVPAGDSFLDADFGFQPPDEPPADPIIDLELTKDVAPEVVAIGDQAVYTISVINQGPADATGVVVTDTVPSGLTVDGFSGPGIVSAVSTASLTWTIGDLAVGDTVTLTVTVTVDEIGPFTNDAEVTAAEQTDIDSVPGDGEGDDFDSALLSTVGVLAVGSIGDTVWLDTDGDGVQDAGESGIAGVTVNLTGLVTQTAVTDAGGKYLFVGLQQGSYTAAVVASTAGENLGLTTAGSYSINLGDGQNFLDADFGLTEVIPITGAFAGDWFFTGMLFLVAGALMLVWVRMVQMAASPTLTDRLRFFNATMPMRPLHR